MCLLFLYRYRVAAKPPLQAEFLEAIKSLPASYDPDAYHNLGPVSERRLSENSEYVNPEMRETLGFPFQNGRFVKPGKAG